MKNTVFTQLILSLCLLILNNSLISWKTYIYEHDTEQTPVEVLELIQAENHTRKGVGNMKIIHLIVSAVFILLFSSSQIIFAASKPVTLSENTCKKILKGNWGSSEGTSFC